MRAWVELYARNPDVYVGRIYPDDLDPAQSFAEQRQYTGVVVLRQETADTVLVGPEVGQLDMAARRDLGNAMRLFGVKKYGQWRRGRLIVRDIAEARH